MIKTPTLLSLSITGVNIFARLFHLLIFLMIGNLYGINKDTDLVFLVYAPLSVVMSVIAGAAQVIIMPGVHRAETRDCVTDFLRALLKRALIFSLIATVVAIAVSIFINMEIVSNYWVLILLAPIPLLACISAFYSNVLNAHDSFKLAALGPVFGALGAILILTMLPSSSVMLALTLLIFETGSALGLWLFARRYALGRSRSNQNAVIEVTKWAMRGAGFQVVGSLLTALNPMINILFAKSLEPGAVTLVEYANRLWNIVPLLFTGSLMVYYSLHSRGASRRDVDRSTTHSVARNLGLVALIFSLVAIFASPYIVDLMYGWGKMADTERSSLAYLLSMYLLGSSVYIASLVYIRAISAMGKVHILTLAALFGVVLNIVFNTVLVRYFGLSGIGIAASLTNVAVALYVYSRFVSQSASDIRYDSGN